MEGSDENWKVLIHNLIRKYGFIINSTHTSCYYKMNRDCFLKRNPLLALTLIRVDITSILIGYGFDTDQARYLAVSFEAELKELLKSGKVI